MADRIADPWGARTPYDRGGPWPERVDAHVPGGDVDRWVATASVLHSNGDGIDIAVRDGRIVGVRGRARTGSITGGWIRRTSTAGRPTTPPTGSRGR